VTEAIVAFLIGVLGGFVLATAQMIVDWRRHRKTMKRRYPA